MLTEIVSVVALLMLNSIHIYILRPDDNYTLSLVVYVHASKRDYVNLAHINVLTNGAFISQCA